MTAATFFKFEDLLFCSLDNIEMPPVESLSVKQILRAAFLVATYFQATPITNFECAQKQFVARTGVYDVVITGESPCAVTARSTCRKFWRRQIEQAADIARLNNEAKYRVVGGKGDDAQIYASDQSVQRLREKKHLVDEYLENQVLINCDTGEKFSLLDLANKGVSNRFNELYWVVKNFESLSSDSDFEWLFITYTSPPRYHPNPLKGRCSYDEKLGVKSSHDFIALAWRRVRANLAKRGTPADPDFYFGIRVAEVHKDGAVHWHILVFIKPELIEGFVEASEEQFPLAGQMKVEYGDSSIGSASSYIFKYLVKGFELSLLKEGIQNFASEEAEEKREEQNLSSIRNGERVRAALKMMRVRQYQPFGVKKLITLIREINKIPAEKFDAAHGLVGTVRDEIWRNPLGLKYLLQHLELVRLVSGVAPIMLLKEACTTSYGEESFKVVGLLIGREVFKRERKYRRVVKAKN